VDRATLGRLRKIIYERSGIVLGDNKEALICARLNKRMQLLGIEDARAYLGYLLEDGTGEEMVQLVDVISTNVTSFFREGEHFAFLGGLVSQWANEGQRRFRLWSAACSTGEEPYSVLMAVLDALKSRSVDLKILATDISRRVLDACACGVYEAGKVKTIPGLLRDRYFERKREGRGVVYSVKEELKQRIAFRWLNLSRPPFPMRGPFDAIFCRNVMIYFDQRTRLNLLAELHRLLRPGGYLMVGHAESLSGIGNGFRIVKPSIYLKA
jgi:chemotaxis protein methyltransferase CheR